MWRHPRLPSNAGSRVWGDSGGSRPFSSAGKSVTEPLHRRGFAPRGPVSASLFRKPTVSVLPVWTMSTDNEILAQIRVYIAHMSDTQAERLSGVSRHTIRRIRSGEAIRL